MMNSVGEDKKEDSLFRVQEKVQVKHEDSLFRKRCESNMKFLSNTKCIFINMKQHMLCNRESPIYPCNRSILFV